MNKLTREQAAIIGAYTGFLCGPFSDMHEYIERVMERPVQTIEMGAEELVKEVREKSKDDFLGLCATENQPC